MNSRSQTRINACWNYLSHADVLGIDSAKWKDRGATRLLSGIRKTGSDIHQSGLAMALAFRAANDPKAYKAISRVTLESLRLDQEPDLLSALTRTREDEATDFLIRATDECALCCAALSYLLKGAGIKDDENEQVTADA